jgi:NADPH:quinone reductase-like Zn-dependent oxidoreductase
MKAAVIKKFGSREELFISNIERPECKENEVLIKVKASSVNPMDCKIRQYGFNNNIKTKFPIVLGIDVAGEIIEVGNNVKEFELGDEVFGYLDMLRMGGYAEYAIALPKEITKKPQEMSFVEAASLPVVAITAFLACFGYTQLQSNQRILVHAAAGGVGSIVVQIANFLGLYVIGTASPNNNEFLSEIGVDEIIDYNSVDFSKKIKNIDIVIDTIGGETQDKSFEVLKDKGWLISVVSSPSETLKKEYDINTGFVFAMPNNEYLDQIVNLYRKGAFKPIIGKTLQLKDIVLAHKLIESRHSKGKIVIKMG